MSVENEAEFVFGREIEENSLGIGIMASLR
jgi:hypothetical protein